MLKVPHLPPSLVNHSLWPLEERQLDSTRVQEAMASISAGKEADLHAMRMRMNPELYEKLVLNNFESSRLPLFDLKRHNASLPIPEVPKSSIEILVLGAHDDIIVDAFNKFIGQPVTVFCSSRTDTGVHDLSNVCHVDVERISKRKPGEVKNGDYDLTVIDVRSVAPDFQSRYKAQERT